MCADSPWAAERPRRRPSAPPAAPSYGEGGAAALAGRHYLGRWFDDPDGPDDLVGLIRDPWVGGRPFLPDGLPAIDRVPGHDNAYAATGHGMLGVTLGPITGHKLTQHLLTGHRPEP
ncbi:FAD-dependent oxidoreductase [Streptomyces sp. NPDC056660]|uniref:FAD-dependent oxidoreductase n=1 Tax=Streptomyces sp. NPDC056660 TaxID=3345897 RepID=UPI0036C9473A